MKNQTSPYPLSSNLFSFSLAILFIFGLNSCSKEEEFNTIPLAEEITSDHNVQFVKENSIPFLKQEVSNIFFEKGLKTNASEHFYLNRDKIMEVTDSLGNKTYSYQLVLKSAPANIFYNVIVDKNKHVSVFEYQVAATHLENFVHSNFDFKYFVGRISIYRGTSFIYALRNQQKNALEPCDSIEISEGSGNGSGSGYTDYGDEEEPIGSGDDSGNNEEDNTGGGTYDCKYEIVEDRDFSSGPSNILEETSVLVITCDPQTRSTECFESSGAYGINIYEYALYRLEYEYNFNFFQLEWLKKEENGELINSEFLINLYTYGMNNEFTAEAEAFSLEATNAKMAGGEVNFEEKIIYTTNIKECVKDIIKKMLNDQEYIDLGDMPAFVKEELNLSGYILDIFNHSDKYNLIFDSAPNLVNNLGQTVNAKTTIRRDFQASTDINFIININLNEDYINNATDLAVARTIIHESLHAYISYIYQDQILSTLSQSLSILLQADGATQGSAQHNLMSQQFVNAISISLESWDESSLTNNDYYNFLSWSGNMLISPAFDALTEDEQAKIINANIAEGSALSIATGLAEGVNNCN